MDMEHIVLLPPEGPVARAGVLQEDGTYLPHMRMCDLANPIGWHEHADWGLGSELAKAVREALPGTDYLKVPPAVLKQWGWYMREDRLPDLERICRDPLVIAQSKAMMEQHRLNAANPTRRKPNKKQLRQLEKTMHNVTATWAQGPNVEAGSGKWVVPSIIVTITAHREGRGRAESVVRIMNFDGITCVYLPDLERALRPETGGAHHNFKRAIRLATEGSPSSLVDMRVPGVGRCASGLMSSALDLAMNKVPRSKFHTLETQLGIIGAIKLAIAEWEASRQPAAEEAAAIEEQEAHPTEAITPEIEAEIEALGHDEVAQDNEPAVPTGGLSAARLFSMVERLVEQNDALLEERKALLVKNDLLADRLHHSTVVLSRMQPAFEAIKEALDRSERACARSNQLVTELTSKVARSRAHLRSVG